MFKKKEIVKKKILMILMMTMMIMIKRLDVVKTATVSFILASVIQKMNILISLNMPKNATRTLQAHIQKRTERLKKQKNN
jgi:hypothetical protein